MAVTLEELLKAHLNGALNIKYDEGANKAIVGGSVEIKKEQADKLCKENFGWLEYRLSPFEIIDKTNKFIKAFKTNLKNVDVFQNTVVEFQNKPDTDYGKTFDRIILTYKNHFKYTLIYNMKSAGGKYVLYNTGSALCIEKFRSLKQFVEYINTCVEDKDDTEEE